MAKVKGKPENKGGRPIKITSKVMRLVEGLALLGLPDARIAALIEVAPSTFAKWKHEDKGFSERLFRSRELSHVRVARSLYEKAVGYRAKSVKVFCSEKGGVTQVPFVEIWPPSEAACMAILKNRHPDLWREKIDVAHDITDKLAERLKAARTRMAKLPGKGEGK